ncbi:MAG: hypothetical protein J6N92_04370 [Alloprevotella sp.]|nr:hypothetical protein [Alloprevotella sp.]
MKKMLLTMAALALWALNLGAQPMPIDVEPGSKGALPEIASVTGELPEGQFAGLSVQQTTVGSTYFGGYSYEIWLNFPQPSELGGEYYTLEYYPSTDGGWSTWLNGDNSVAHFTYDNAVCSNSHQQYRLRMHGGPMDGYISNTVTRKYQSMVTRWGGWSDQPGQYTLVGQPQGDKFVFSVSTYTGGGWEGETQYTNDKTFVYSWYRRNPVTWEMTKIAGANDTAYVPTIEDVGYELIEVIEGDEIHHSFYFAYPRGLVTLPVRASVGYYGPDGFVLNTDYDISKPEENIGLGESMYDECKPVAEGTIKKRQAGQYAFYMPLHEYEGQIIDMLKPGYTMTFTYNVEWEQGESEEWIREAQLMYGRWCKPICVVPQVNGQTVATEVDLIGPDIDGNIVVKASSDEENEAYPAEKAEDGSVTLQVWEGLDYYVKARATDATLDTYYPNALLWSQGETVKAYAEEGFDDKDNWYSHPATYTFELIPVPAALDGAGSIEGTITDVTPTDTDVEALRRRIAKKTTEETPTSYTVYLFDLDKESKMVAKATTDVDGNYRFEKVPFGSYSVNVNLDGCTQTSAWTVSLSEDKHSVKGVDYTINGFEITPAKNEDAADLNGDGAVNVGDVTTLVNMILGKAEMSSAADLNGDGSVNVGDVTTLVNMILGK